MASLGWPIYKSELIDKAIKECSFMVRGVNGIRIIKEDGTIEDVTNLKSVDIIFELDDREKEVLRPI